MKKVLIGLALLGGLYFAFGKPKKDTPGVDSGNGNNDFFAEFENQMVKDSDGIHFLVKDGKMYNAETSESYSAWFANNPAKQLMQVDQPIWKTYAETNYGGTF